MDARRDWAFDADEDTTVHEEVWLLGQPPLRDYLSYVRKTVLGGEALAREELVNEWRVANDRFYDLEENEAGFADRGEVQRHRCLRLRRSWRRSGGIARFARAFDSLPTRFAMVELDRLVVEQPHINLSHVERLKTRIGGFGKPGGAFSFCLPLNPALQPMSKTRRNGIEEVPVLVGFVRLPAS